MSNRPWGTVNGPSAPSSPTRAPSPRSFRRSSTVDVVRPDGLAGRLVLVARARDLAVADDGAVAALDEAFFDLETDRARVVRSATWSEEDPSAAALAGRSIGRGFRAAAAARLDPDGALRLLADDVAIVGPVTGYAEIYMGSVRPGPGTFTPDICSGFRRGGTLQRSVETTGDLALPRGPLAPEPGEGWHPTPELAPLSMRRRRCIDVVLAGERATLSAMFRDSFVDVACDERVVHEYEVAGSVDLNTMRFVHVEAVPRVLPWAECPAAALSARVLEGVAVEECRSHVDSIEPDSRSCTHLDAALRSLGACVRRAVDTRDAIHIHNSR